MIGANTNSNLVFGGVVDAFVVQFDWKIDVNLENKDINIFKYFLDRYEIK